MTRPPEVPLSQTVDVETPELVVLSYTVAGLGSRVQAALIDFLIILATLIGVIITYGMLRGRLADPDAGPTTRTDAWFIAVLTLLTFAIYWGYYVLFEGLADGQTPGKRATRLRVVRDGGYSVGFAASAVRNLMRVVDGQPGITYFVGILGIVFSRSGKRLGDIVAGTLVVREELVRTPNLHRRRVDPAATPSHAVAALLSDEDYQLLERWVERSRDIDPARRGALALRIGERVGHAVSDDGTPLPARLARLYENEYGARQQGLAARAATGASRERYAIVATQSPRWTTFAATLADTQRRGLASLGESGVRNFVAEYRALSSDLARLQTATRGTASAETFYLGRLVAAAHNLIYRDRTSDLLGVFRVFTRDIPREIRRSWAPITLAAVLLFGPGVIAYTAVVRHPEIAPTFIPSGMLERAIEGSRRAEQGIGYIPDPQTFRPVLASRIIRNNVQVTFAAFAFGATLGIGTVLMLLMNGMSFGGIMGLYASRGIGDLILAFVAPHGVLELTAICIAAGGGFLIAGSIVLPGNRTRRAAFAENTVRAIRLIGASTLMLIVAGTIEGMVSPIPYWPLSLKLCVSAATAVLLYVYLRLGTSGPATTPATPAASEQAFGFYLEVPVDDRGGHLRR